MKDESNVFATLLLPSSVIGYSDCFINISMYCSVLVCRLPMQMQINHVAFFIIARNSQEWYTSAYKLQLYSNWIRIYGYNRYRRQKLKLTTQHHIHPVCMPYYVSLIQQEYEHVIYNNLIQYASHVSMIQNYEVSSPLHNYGYL